MIPDVGVSYEIIDKYITTGIGNVDDIAIIEKYHSISDHKRTMPAVYNKL